MNLLTVFERQESATINGWLDRVCATSFSEFSKPVYSHMVVCSPKILTSEHLALALRLPPKRDK